MASLVSIERGMRAPWMGDIPLGEKMREREGQGQWAQRMEEEEDMPGKAGDEVAACPWFCSMRLLLCNAYTHWCDQCIRQARCCRRCGVYEWLILDGMAWDGLALISTFPLIQTRA